jgi:sugar phosphate isomerase/epimerase
VSERIGIVTDEISQDLSACREFLEEHGLRMVELRGVGGRRVPDLTSGDLATLRSWVAGGEIEVLGVSPGIFKCDVGDRESARRHQEEVLPRSLDLARDLGARFVVAFPFENLLGLPPGREPFDRLAAAAEACAVAGLPLLVENEPGFLASTGAEIAALLEAVGHENLLVNWDPANASDLGRVALGDGLRKIFARVRHVHVKNGRVRPGERFPAYGPLAAGDIDWPAHLALLDELGYAGRFGVETHFEPLRESSAAVVKELRSMLAELESGGRG